MVDQDDRPMVQKNMKNKLYWIWVLLLVGIFSLGAYFRFTGIDWDENQHVHPDERFLTMVASSVQPVKSLSDFFNTDTSTLNPHNVGYGFYVYGTLPLFIVRYVGEWVGQTGYGEIYLVGRFLSAAFDLLTVLLAFLIALKLYKNTRLALIGMAFSAFAVLQIQLSHFFTVDTYANFFTYLAMYFAVGIMEQLKETSQPTGDTDEEQPASTWRDQPRLIWLFSLFGIALGMAVASKVNTAAVAILLPLGAYLGWSQIKDKALQRKLLPRIAGYLVLAALVSLLIFRIFQPYAFTGPGFLDVKINPKWWANLTELRNQSTGDVDFPPALQWARRPVWFGFQNMTQWGLGLPLGVLGWASFVWMGIRMFKGEFRQHIFLWLWTAVYFAWQGIGFVTSMRYLLPLYPVMGMLAAWGILSLWEWANPQNTTGGSDVHPSSALKKKSLAKKVLAAFVAVFALTSTFLWAFAFSRIYTRTETRVAASEWIYQNIPGAINLHLVTADNQMINQPYALYAGMNLEPGRAVTLAFRPSATGELTQVLLSNVVDAQPAVDAQNQRLSRSILVSIFTGDGQQVGYGQYSGVIADDQVRTIVLDDPVAVVEGEPYRIRFECPDEGASLIVYGQASLTIETPQRPVTQYLPDLLQTIRTDREYLLSATRFSENGTIQEIELYRVVDLEDQPGEKTLEISLLAPGEVTPLATAYLTSEFRAGQDARGESYLVQFDNPVLVNVEKVYAIQIKLVSGNGAIAIYSSKPVIETSWDMTVPFDMGRGNAFDSYAGIYRTDLNFEMYWDDNVDKRERILSMLDRADVIFSSTNRVWGTVPRVPERYPVSTEFYRLLLGCPEDQSVVKCYNLAEVGTYAGQLGFDLVYAGTSYPNLGSWQFNTQFAEEAFTVYDHPKVMIFRKNENYDPEKVRSLLEAVDVSKAVHITPRQASSYKGILTLPTERLAAQKAGGTWSVLFNTEGLINRVPLIGMILWYVCITLLGWAVFPFVRLALYGLRDHGYAFSKLAGMLILAWLVWLSGSAGIPVTQVTISVIFVILLMLNLALAAWQRRPFITELKEQKGHILTVELITLAFFVIFILIRLGNPDLWHPAKGGEKPMDFSYLNAVIKSTTYPPYDPWYAGGYINYYYYGFVIVGVLVKWLGIVPSIAYNLILPTLYSLTAIGAFNVVWNLVAGAHTSRRPYQFGIAGAALATTAGNLGSVWMIWQGLQRIGLPGGIAAIEDGSFFQRIGWGLTGIWKYVQGASLPYGWGEWYWNPSRIYPGSPITEFPAFTFLYADLHAHMIALPITLMAAGFALSILMGRWRWDAVPTRKWVGFAASLVFGGIVIGALRPTNTWDLPAYLILTSLVILYTAVRYADIPGILRGLDRSWAAALAGLASAALLVLCAFVFYQPFAQWYAQGYSSVALWKEAEQASVKLYLVHWGLFLFILASWLWQESVDWMAATPVSALNKIRPYKAAITLFGLAAILAIVLLALVEEVQIAWVVIPMAIWAGVLFLRPDQSDAKRLILFLTGTALVITIFVELFVLVGDIGRMNTVFKFYMQAWSMFAVSSAAALYWLVPVVQQRWSSGWRRGWQIGLGLLVGGVLLFPLLAGADKIRDRMSLEAPHTLDGMAYMRTSFYNENGVDMDLSYDYRAIRWMQENVQGSPVIVEGKTGEYHWGTRFTIYTGLPGVVGWNWHQIQQRSTLPGEWVTNRIMEISTFYTTTNLDLATAFLGKYDVRYIILGQLETAVYPGEGLNKFAAYNGTYWNEVYRDGSTIIYEVKK